MQAVAAAAAALQPAVVSQYPAGCINQLLAGDSPVCRGWVALAHIPDIVIDIFSKPGDRICRSHMIVTGTRTVTA